MSTFEIERGYKHRDHGEIGTAMLQVTGVDTVTLNGTKLPDDSVEYLLHFALQSLQDAYAGAKTADEAKAAWEKKLKAVQEGMVGVRVGGGGISEETRVARSIVRSAVKAKFGGKSPEWAKFTGLSDDAQAAKLDEWFAANEAAFRPAVDEKLAQLAAERKAKQGLAKKVEFDL